MTTAIFWEGFILLTAGRGLVPVEIWRDGEYVNVYLNGDLADDIEYKEDLVDSYGDRFFETLEDFKNDEWSSIEEVWPK